MIIESIRHKALKQFFETGSSKGMVGDAERIGRMLAFMVAAQTLDELSVPPNYGLHALVGNRKGGWSMIVTRNWRLTFELNSEGNVINMDLEDYHGA